MECLGIEGKTKHVCTLGVECQIQSYVSKILGRAGMNEIWETLQGEIV